MSPRGPFDEAAPPCFISLMIDSQNGYGSVRWGLSGLKLWALWLALAPICLPFLASAEGAAHHVVHISADGLGGVYLKEYLAESPAEFPAFRRLARQGACTFNARCDSHLSLTEPNHSSMLTGRPVLQQPTNVTFSAPHGFTVNYDPGPPWTLHNFGNPAVPYKASVFDVVHDHGRSTAFFAAKEKFAMFVRSYDADHGAPDAVGPDDGRNKMDWSQIIDWGGPDHVRRNDSNLVSRVLERLSAAPPAYTFLHVAGPDIAGHYYLWGSPEYRQAVREVDRHLGRILAAIEANPALSNRTAIVLTADHGGGDSSGSHVHPDELPTFTIPLMLWGPEAPAGRDLYDLFSNRAEPGAQHLDHDAPRQPLRNGDSGNLALALLGLPAIPGACLVPEWKPRLRIEPAAGTMVLAWPVTAAAFDLEYSDVSSGGRWTRIAEGIVVENGWNRFSFTPSLQLPARFYRLVRAAAP